MPSSVCSERQGRTKKSVDKKGEEGRDKFNAPELLWIPTDQAQATCTATSCEADRQGWAFEPLLP